MASVPIKILTSMATKEALSALAAEYPQAATQPIEIESVGGVNAAERVRAGEVLDVIVLAANVIDGLIASGKVLAGSRHDFASSGVTVCVRAGAAKPDISSAEAVKRALVAAKTVCYSTGPSGVYLEKLFEQWGITDLIKPKLAIAPPGVPVGSFVADGKGEIGFQQLSELIHLPGIDIVGGLPDEIQKRTTFSAGIPVTCANVEATRALLAFMVSPAAAASKRQHGMEPA
jgi:molybdate transport system substrate-binding protein